MTTYLDGHRLTESQRLKLLADEEYAALEGQFYAYYAGDTYTAAMAQALLPAPAAVAVAAQTPSTQVSRAAPAAWPMDRHEAALIAVHGQPQAVMRDRSMAAGVVALLAATFAR